MTDPNSDVALGDSGSKHIAILTTGHPIDDIRVYSRMARTFVDSGYRVTWIGPETYMNDATASRDPQITYMTYRPNNSRLRRALAWRAAEGAASAATGVDWWYCPDPDAASTAIKVAKRQGGRLLFDIHEVYHGALLDRWFPMPAPNVVREVVRKRISRTCSQAALVVGVSKSVLSPYVDDSVRQVIARSCAPDWFSEGSDPQPEARLDGRLRVMHGKALPGRGTDEVIEALGLLDKTAQVELEVLMSTSAETPYVIDVRQRVAQLAAPDTVTIAGSLPHQEMPALLRSCELGMIAYGRDLGVDSLPNRLFEYMAVGLAVLAPSYAPEIREILEKYNCGFVADFEDPADVARALRWALDHRDELIQMGRRGRQAFNQDLNWSAESAGLINAMHEVEEGR